MYENTFDGTIDSVSIKEIGADGTYLHEDLTVGKMQSPVVKITGSEFKCDKCDISAYGYNLSGNSCGCGGTLHIWNGVRSLGSGPRELFENGESVDIVECIGIAESVKHVPHYKSEDNGLCCTCRWWDLLFTTPKCWSWKKNGVGIIQETILGQCRYDAPNVGEDVRYGFATNSTYPFREWPCTRMCEWCKKYEFYGDFE